jgi:hypothetical protein
MARKMTRSPKEGEEKAEGNEMYAGELGSLNDRDFAEIVAAFFER